MTETASPGSEAPSWAAAALAFVAAAAAGIAAFTVMGLARTADYRAAEAAMRPEVAPGDIVFLAPRQTIEFINELPEFAVLAPKPGTYVPLHGFKRVWTVSRDRRGPHQGLWPWTNVWRPDPAWSGPEGRAFGELRVARMVLPRFATWPAFAKARAETRCVTAGGEQGPCAEPARPCTGAGHAKRRCGPEAWQNTGPEAINVNGEATECLFVHPIPGKEITLVFDGAAISSHLDVYGAFSDDAAKGDVPAVTIHARAIAATGSSETILTFPQRRGFQAHTIPLNLGTGPKTLEFGIRTAKAGRQHFCLAAEGD